MGKYGKDSSNSAISRVVKNLHVTNHKFDASVRVKRLQCGNGVEIMQEIPRMS